MIAVVVLLLAAWIVLSVVVGLAIGAAIHRADVMELGGRPSVPGRGEDVRPAPRPVAVVRERIAA